MSVRMTGREFKDYYADASAWPDGAYHDDTVFVIDGKELEAVDETKLADDSVVEIKTGAVFLPDGGDDDLVEHASRWQAKQAGVYGQFYVPKENLSAVIEAIKAAGGRVIEGGSQ